MAAPEAPKTKLATLFGSANKFEPGANPVENSKMLKKWVFAFVNKAAEGKDTLNWLMDYATPGFFDNGSTYDSSYGSMTKGEQDMCDVTLRYYIRNYSEGALLEFRLPLADFSQWSSHAVSNSATALPLRGGRDP